MFGKSKKEETEQVTEEIAEKDPDVRYKDDVGERIVRHPTTGEYMVLWSNDRKIFDPILRVFVPDKKLKKYYPLSRWNLHKEVEVFAIIRVEKEASVADLEDENALSQVKYYKIPIKFSIRDLPENKDCYITTSDNIRVMGDGSRVVYTSVFMSNLNGLTGRGGRLTTPIQYQNQLPEVSVKRGKVKRLKNGEEAQELVQNEKVIGIFGDLELRKLRI